MRVTLPLPPACLSPNARAHWRTKHKAARAYRALACAMTPKKGLAERWMRAQVQLTFYHAFRRERDADNALASMKAGIDGITDAGVVINDSGFSYLPVRFELDTRNPRVEVEITPLGEP